jgi:hypothetical protein
MGAIRHDMTGGPPGHEVGHVDAFWHGPATVGWGWVFEWWCCCGDGERLEGLGRDAGAWTAGNAAGVHWGSMSALRDM